MRMRGQAMVELALVFPLFAMVIVGIITLGIGVFYQQQVTNAAREAARFASIHSATAKCPTVPHLPYEPASPALSYDRCDTPEEGWADMTAAARGRIFGVNSADVNIVACWSGYRMDDTNAYDAPPDELEVDLGGTPFTYQTHWAQCTIDGADPTTAPSSIGCDAALEGKIVDQASAQSEGPGRPVANTVTAYACYTWTPPMAGFLLIPPSVTLRGVVTEPIERQQ
jgi:hypothetical protein